MTPMRSASTSGYVGGPLEMGYASMPAIPVEVNSVHVRTQKVVVEIDVLNRELLDVSELHRERFGVLQGQVRDAQVLDVVESDKHTQKTRRIVGDLRREIMGGLVGVVPVPDAALDPNAAVHAGPAVVGQHERVGLVGKANDRIPVHQDRLPGIHNERLADQIACRG